MSDDDKYEKLDNHAIEVLRGTEQWNQGVHEAVELAAGFAQLIGNGVAMLGNNTPIGQVLDHMNDLPADLAMHLPGNIALGKSSVRPMIVFANYMQNCAHFSAQGHVNPAQAAVFKTVDDQLKGILTDAAVFGSLKRIAPKLAGPVGWGLLVSDAVNFIDQSPQFQQKIQAAEQQVQEHYSQTHEAFVQGDLSAALQLGHIYAVRQNMEDVDTLKRLVTLPSKILDAAWSGAKEALCGTQAKASNPDISEQSAYIQKKNVDKNTPSAKPIKEPSYRSSRENSPLLFNQPNQERTMFFKHEPNVGEQLNALPQHIALNKALMAQVIKNSNDQRLDIKSLQGLLQHNNVKLADLKQLVQANKIGVDSIFKYVGALYNESMQRQSRERTIAFYDGVQKGFGCMSEIGRLSKNPTLQAIGVIGESMVEAAIQFGNISAALSVTNFIGPEMMNPYVMIAKAALTVVSHFVNRKRSKKAARQQQAQQRALFGALDHISRQNVQLFESITKGFGITFENQQKILESIDHYMHKIGGALEQIFEHNVKVEENLNEVKQQLDGIALQLHGQSLEHIERASRNINNGGSPDCAVFLADINMAQDKAITGDVCSLILKQRGNRSGWYYHHHLVELTEHLELAEFDFLHDVQNVPNLLWLNKIAMPALKHADYLLNVRQTGIYATLAEHCESTLEFLEGLKSERFIRALADKTHSDIDALANQANDIVKLINAQYTQASQKTIIKDQLAKSKNPDAPAHKKWAEDWSKNGCENAKKLVQSLKAIVRQYNKRVTHSQQMWGVVCSILNVDPACHTMLKDLMAIPCININAISDQILSAVENGVTVSFLAGPFCRELDTVRPVQTNNAPIFEDMRNGADKLIEYCLSIKNIASLYDGLMTLVASADQYAPNNVTEQEHPIMSNRML